MKRCPVVRFGDGTSSWNTLQVGKFTKNVWRFLNPVKQLTKIEGFVTWQVDLEVVLCIAVIPLNMLILIQGAIEQIDSVIVVMQS